MTIQPWSLHPLLFPLYALYLSVRLSEITLTRVSVSRMVFTTAQGACGQCRGFSSQPSDKRTNFMIKICLTREFHYSLSLSQSMFSATDHWHYDVQWTNEFTKSRTLPRTRSTEDWDLTTWRESGERTDEKMPIWREPFESQILSRCIVRRASTFRWDTTLLNFNNSWLFRA